MLLLVSAGVAIAQRALLRGATARLLSPPPHVQAGRSPRASPVPRASVSGTALVRAGHRVIGHVTVWISLADRLSRLSQQSGVEIVAPVDGCSSTDAGTTSQPETREWPNHSPRKDGSPSRTRACTTLYGDRPRPTS
jgi:hypothetical protein